MCQNWLKGEWKQNKEYRETRAKYKQLVFYTLRFFTGPIYQKPKHPVFTQFWIIIVGMSHMPSTNGHVPYVQYQQNVPPGVGTLPEIICKRHLKSGKRWKRCSVHHDGSGSPDPAVTIQALTINKIWSLIYKVKKVPVSQNYPETILCYRCWIKKNKLTKHFEWNKK